jgi:hypothetical protein
MICALCHKRADRKVTYGLYAEYENGRPHHCLYLCGHCTNNLLTGVGCAPLQPLVTAGLSQFVVEPV